MSKMSNLQVNTDVVKAFATDIEVINAQIRDGFFEVQSAINQLDSTWDGRASENSIRVFNDIKAKYTDSRYVIMDNYVKYLKQVVGEGDEQTENANIALADYFK